MGSVIEPPLPQSGGQTLHRLESLWSQLPCAHVSVDRKRPVPDLLGDHCHLMLGAVGLLREAVLEVGSVLVVLERVEEQCPVIPGLPQFEAGLSQIEQQMRIVRLLGQHGAEQLQ